MQQTTEMETALHAELTRLGWGAKIGRLVWGRRVSGNAHGVALERDGVVQYHSGPFVVVRGGEQAAIVRFG